MEDNYCYCGQPWTKVFNTTLYSDCYYCHNCDKIYELTATEITKERFKKSFTSDRFNQIKGYAKMIEAKKKVTNGDLVKLGYLED